VLEVPVIHSWSQMRGRGARNDAINVKILFFFGSETLFSGNNYEKIFERNSETINEENKERKK
jgi:chemotaxis receptor (MCP) glutamine deamidase CheD